MLPPELAPALDNGAPEFADEAALLQWLAAKIGDLLLHRTEFLFNVFYCMDVDERKMHEALAPNAPEPADIGLARLMIARQRERLQTKQLYKQPPIDGEDFFSA
jgi:hypothetical protein